jgi:hypothetical protein
MKKNSYNSIKSIWTDKRVSKGNLLHPTQYKYISSSKVRNLIMAVDLHKYHTRKHRGKGAVNNWRKELNRSILNKKFRGNWTKKNPGVLSRETLNS